MRRVDGRAADDLRPVTIRTDYLTYPEGSALIAMGSTLVVCNVTVQPGVPRWMEVQKIEGGWVTGEYALLPRATQQRTPRETTGLRGRTQEIRRFVGRSLRAAINLADLKGRTCIVDCDVLQADGGTRTAAVTGGYIALALALDKLVRLGDISTGVLKSPVAAVSVGVVAGSSLLDLCYAEDVQADVDVNVVMNAQGHYIEVQGTAENAPFSPAQLEEMLALAAKGIEKLLAAQQTALERTVFT